ncbi:helix-turn-helix transcriptional regulator [Mesorhizobium denitrificans]|uniref:AlpA family phage regulatory protein n=1 Tax=Mesorhizobium denitrificans TaxID=2294114 RepID=A0A371XFU6_9HYPH|nr:AlpA family phage regulatory protein [Mesorhizobium denitrificans]
MSALSDRLLSIDEVKVMVGLSAPTIWRLRKAGQFPNPLKITPGMTGATRWRLSELIAWVDTRERSL